LNSSCIKKKRERSRENITGLKDSENLVESKNRNPSRL
jgi:hypothetical protein